MMEKLRITLLITIALLLVMAVVELDILIDVNQEIAGTIIVCKED